MANSGTVASGQQATATQYNNLRADVLDPATGHDHTGEADHGSVILPTLFGDGSDGSVTVTSGTFSGGPITSNALTRDAFFVNLTLNAGATLDPHGFRLFVSGTLTIGTGAVLGGVGGNGGNGAANAYGAVGAGGAGGSLPAGGQGGNGGINTGGGSKGGGGGGGGGPIVLVIARFVTNNGTIQANGGNGGTGFTGTGLAYGSNVTASAGNAPGSGAMGGAGGHGGKGQEATGGVGGSPSLSTTPTYGALYRTLLGWLLAGQPYGGTNVLLFSGGGGGGGGGSNNSTYQAGVGGGGGGGLVVILYHRATWGTEQALGGVSGATGDLTNATNGTAGTVIKMQV